MNDFEIKIKGKDKEGTIYLFHKFIKNKYKNDISLVEIEVVSSDDTESATIDFTEGEFEDFHKACSLIMERIYKSIINRDSGEFFPDKHKGDGIKLREEG